MKSLFAELPQTEFKGYETLECQAKVVAILDADTMQKQDISSEKSVIITDVTPFYGEGGGQVGDKGTIEGANGKATVYDTRKNDGVFIHFCDITNGSFSVGDVVTLTVSSDSRCATARNHSSVHLLDAALREVLGEHVRQAGSYVDENEGRFDFTHFAPMSKEEIDKVEKLVNQKILENLNVSTEVMDIESAKKSGAIALFGEKYGDYVRVVKMGDFSSELCGGTHVSSTGSIGLFRIVSESSVAAGTRRITSVTGFKAYEQSKCESELLKEIELTLKANNQTEIVGKITALQNDLKKVKKDLEDSQVKNAAAQTDEVMSKAIEVNGLKVVTMKTSLPSDTLRTLSDNIKSSHDNVVALLSTNANDKLTLVCVCGKEAIAKGAKAGDLIKSVCKIVGGGGGGRPDSATAGGKDESKLDEAFKAFAEMVSSST
jgi:alanyl-tRNA synthetase